MTSTVDQRREEVWRQLTRVIDPEIGMNIVELGLVYGVAINRDLVDVIMTLTTQGCPLQSVMIDGVKGVVNELPWVRDVSVRIAWDPPWNPGMIRW